MKSRITLSLLGLALALLVLPTRTIAHGAAEITVTPDTVAAGGQIMVKGTKLDKNADVKISLEGLTYRASLGTAHTDANEAFEQQFTIPADAPEGEYQVKAITEDGDAVSADLTVTPPLKAVGPVPTATSVVRPAAAPGATPMTMATPEANAPTNPTPQASQAPEAMPSAAEHELPRSRTPGEVAGLFALAIASAAIGVVLVRRK